MTLDDLLTATEGASWDQLDTVVQVAIARMMDLADERARHELEAASLAVVRAGQAMRGVS